MAASAPVPDTDTLLQAVFTFIDQHDASESFGVKSQASASPSTSCESVGDSHSESSDSALSPKAEPTTPAPSTDPPRKTGRPQRTGVRSDKRQREEMIALREESLALQERLNELKSHMIQSMHGAKPMKRRATDQPDGDEERKEERRKLRAQAWQAVSEVQQKRLEAAEEERERLKELIDQQKKSFRQLRRYLVRHAGKSKDFEALAPMSLFNEEEEDTATESSSDVEVDFDELSRTLPTMHLQTGALFKDQRLENVITTLRDVKVQNEESHKMTIEALESNVVPFDVDTTAQAIWQHHLAKAHRRIDIPEERDTLEITDTCIRRAFRAAIELNGGITRSRGRMETRRYVEANRVIIVQSSIMDHIEHSSMHVPNFAIRHFQWTVIGPPRNPMLRESGKPMSQVEIYGVNVPTMTDFIMDDSSLREAIKRGCVEAVGIQLEFERQSVENLLMQKLLDTTDVDRNILRRMPDCMSPVPKNQSRSMNAIPTTPADVGVDDGDLLHAVMAFLNDNDAVPIDVDDATTTDAYSSSHSDHTASPTHSAKEEPSGVLPRLQPRRPKINRSRQRMRQETIALREHVLELQDRLEVLQGGVSSKVGIPPAKKLVQERESRDARHLRALAWQAIAEHESVKKQAAEEERERLRALLKEQKLAFRRLRRYLSKYGANSQWAPLKNDLFTDGETPDDEVKPELKTDHDGFDDITRTLPAMYLQTNAVFADTRLDHLTSSLRDIKIQNPLTPTMSVEALDSRLVPFDLAQTARAVWEFHRTKVRELSTSEDKRLEESDDCIRREFSSAIEHQQICGMSRVRMETRRYVEQERVVFVQSAIYDNLVVDNTLVPNYGLRQFQWTVICPPRHYLMRQSGKPMSQVEVYEVTVPILDHVTGIERTDLLVRMKKLCEVTADVHRELERESVETILMDSLLKSTNLDSAMFQPPSIAAL